jgi:hypothetical protein
VKAFINELSQKAAGVGELIHDCTPAVKEKLAEAGRSAKAQVVLTQESLAAKSVQACEIAQDVIASQRSQELVHNITAGFNNFKESVTTVVASVVDKSAPIDVPVSADQNTDKAKLANAIKKLSGRDKVGVSAEVLATAGGAAAGIAAASTVAGAAGATTLLGSTGLASLFGGIFVTTTPVGWVIGSAVIAGAAGYGLMRMVRSGASQDITRREMIERLTKRLSSLQEQSEEQAPLVELRQLVALTLAAELISDEQGRRIVKLVENGSLNPALAVDRLKSLALQAGIIEPANPALPSPESS